MAERFGDIVNAALWFLSGCGITWLIYRIRGYRMVNGDEDHA